MGLEESAYSGDHLKLTLITYSIGCCRAKLLINGGKLGSKQTRRYQNKDIFKMNIGKGIKAKTISALGWLAFCLSCSPMLPIISLKDLRLMFSQEVPSFGLYYRVFHDLKITSPHSWPSAYLPYQKREAQACSSYHVKC